LFRSLFIPSIWGLFSRRIGSKAVWLSMGITYLLGFVIKAGFFDEIVSKQVEFVDAFIGFVVPSTILVIMELFLWKKEKDKGWNRFIQISKQIEVQDEKEKQKSKEARSLYSYMTIQI